MFQASGSFMKPSVTRAWIFKLSFDTTSYNCPQQGLHVVFYFFHFFFEMFQAKGSILMPSVTRAWFFELNIYTTSNYSMPII
jgi:hypothetical protein